MLHPAILEFGQRNYVIFELIDTLLRLGYQPEEILLDGRNPAYDLVIDKPDGVPFLSMRCEIWEDDFDKAAIALREDQAGRPSIAPLHVLYTSRLKAGLIDRRYLVFVRDEPVNRAWQSGLLEEEIKPFEPVFKVSANDAGPKEGWNTTAADGFLIRDGILINHRGQAEDLEIPHGVKKLANAVFWNRAGLRKVVLPDTLVSLGGDTFFGCSDLEQLEIPSSVRNLGDNPFADCPRLNLQNQSPWFTYADGILMDRATTRVIYNSILGNSSHLELPDGLVSVGKHAFHRCRRLKEISLPPRLRIVENNPFSDCPDLVLLNRSPHFVIQDGALYDACLSTLFSYALGRDADCLEIPEGVRIIGRHSFYNCQRLFTVVLPRSTKTIGYNPFARCANLRLVNHSPHFVYEDDALYDERRRELIYCSIARPGETFVVPNGVKKIGRSAFFGCNNLREVVLPSGLETIERSAFANCTELERLVLPDTVNSLGEWAFMDCKSLKDVTVPLHVSFEQQTFIGSSIATPEPRV